MTEINFKSELDFEQFNKFVKFLSWLKQNKKEKLQFNNLNAIIKKECNCPCHSDNSIKHCFPYCDGGYIETPIIH